MFSQSFRLLRTSCVQMYLGLRFQFTCGVIILLHLSLADFMGIQCWHDWVCLHPSWIAENWVIYRIEWSYFNRNRFFFIDYIRLVGKAWNNNHGYSLRDRVRATTAGDRLGLRLFLIKLRCTNIQQPFHWSICLQGMLCIRYKQRSFKIDDVSHIIQRAYLHLYSYLVNIWYRCHLSLDDYHQCWLKWNWFLFSRKEGRRTTIDEWMQKSTSTFIFQSCESEDRYMVWGCLYGVILYMSHAKLLAGGMEV